MSGGAEASQIACGKYSYLKALKKPLWEEPKSDNKMIAFDLEAYVDRDSNSEFVPYAVALRHGGEGSYFDNERVVKKYYLMDFEGESPRQKASNMLFAALQYLLQPKFIGWKVYAHNLSGYDGIILMRYLQEVEDLKLKPIMRDAEVFEVCYSYPASKLADMTETPVKGANNNRKHRSTNARICFKDSAKLIQGKLGDLGKSFGCRTTKGEFPHDFASYENLLYNGPWPCSEHCESKAEVLDFKAEALEHVTRDVDLLYELLVIFNNRIEKEFNLNINDYLTLPSLALAVYRKDFMPDVKIPVLTGPVESFIRRGYRGGVVEVYKPILKDGYYYDVNSLYPAAMKKDMPVGDPVFVTNAKLEDIFGFCDVVVEAPPGIKVPLLSTKNAEGKVVQPLGRWRDVYWSELLKKAESVGYKVHVISAYHFERSNKVFDKYVSYFYDKKKNSIDPASRSIYKLFLNSLYGKFGMRGLETETVCVDLAGLNRIINVHEVRSAIYFDEGGSKQQVLVEYVKVPDIDLCRDHEKFLKAQGEADSRNRRRQSCVGIAAAVTAEAQLIMYEYLTIDGNPPFYIDTDSGVYQHMLEPKYVSDELGYMKLEYIVKNGIFVKPKEYYLETPEGEVKKFKGVSSKLVNRRHYEDLYNNKSVSFIVERFMKNPKTGVRLSRMNITISPPFNDKRIKVYDESGA